MWEEGKTWIRVLEHIHNPPRKYLEKTGLKANSERNIEGKSHGTRNQELKDQGANKDIDG